MQFIKYLRDLGYEASSDEKISQVFDICYDYDILTILKIICWKRAIANLELIIFLTEMIYPKNYVKYRLLGKYDFKRIASYDNKYPIKKL